MSRSCACGSRGPARRLSLGGALRRLSAPWSGARWPPGPDRQRAAGPGARRQIPASTCAIAWKRGSLALALPGGDLHPRRSQAARRGGVGRPPLAAEGHPQPADARARGGARSAGGEDRGRRLGARGFRRLLDGAPLRLARDQPRRAGRRRRAERARRTTCRARAPAPSPDGGRSCSSAATTLRGLLLARTVVGGGERMDPVRPAAEERKPIAHGGLRLQLASGWAPAKAATVPGFSRPLGLASAGERLRAVVERLPASSPTLLPAAFERTWCRRGERGPTRVRLASGQPAWRYRFPKADGSVTVPLRGADDRLGGDRRGARAPPVRAYRADARRSRAASRCPGARPLEPGTSSAFFSRLPVRGQRPRTSATRGGVAQPVQRRLTPVARRRRLPGSSVPTRRRPPRHSRRWP